ncbi:MAG: thiamine biosynthesis protein ThiF [Promicromonosporaceae bacterium]|nr:thiamine biosynthesis protein ThiF [Promicromonosporaceae bacterium]
MTTAISPKNSGRLRLRPGTIWLDRGEGAIQLGTDPRWALRIDGLTEDEAAWLRDLTHRRHVKTAILAKRRGITPDRQAALIGLLRQSGFTHLRPRAAAEVPLPGNCAADAIVLGLLRIDGIGENTLANRASAAVALTSLDRLGATIALGLASAGVGTLILPNDDLVQFEDVGLGPYCPGDVGRDRRKTLANALHRAAPQVAIAPDGRPAVVVFGEAHAPNPARYLRLMGTGVAHLVVTTREADMAVGPFVLPGITSCVWCLDLHHQDEDPAWPGIRDQLFTAAAPLHETAVTAVAAAVACAQVLAHLDGLRPQTANNILEIALPQAIPAHRSLPPHPKCGCSSLNQR